MSLPYNGKSVTISQCCHARVSPYHCTHQSSPSMCVGAQHTLPTSKHSAVGKIPPPLPCKSDSIIMEDIVDMDDGYDEERNGIGNLTELDFRVMYDVDGRYSAAASNFST